MPASTRSKSKACKAAGKRGKYLQTVKPFAEKFDPALWVPKEWKTLFDDCATKEEFRAILKEFLMLAFWRVRHFETPIIEKLLGFLQPRRQGVINAIDEVKTFERMMQELQALITFAHEVCARIWLQTPTGMEFQATMRRLR